MRVMLRDGINDAPVRAHILTIDGSSCSLACMCCVLARNKPATRLFSEKSISLLLKNEISAAVRASTEPLDAVVKR
ncbi:hypothetical protein C5N14_01820 [Micromonospora sp. MW-13]|nr:hypothetical protein C5N14_01820 [Micromonospora sp. MW-13]